MVPLSLGLSLLVNVDFGAPIVGCLGDNALAIVWAF